jgi:hypothetical protein
MRRRRFLALTGGSLPASLGGCLGSDGDGVETDSSSTRTKATETTGTDGIENPLDARAEPPAYNCEEATRPEPDAPDDEDAIAPAAYPDRPGSLSDDERAVQYVEAYETAYRRNSLVAQYWNQLVRFSVSVDERWTYDVPTDAAVVRLQYRYSEEVETPNGIVIGDSPSIFVSYYVDESVVVRAERRGRREDESESGSEPALDPDPWREGEPLECFENEVQYEVAQFGVRIAAPRWRQENPDASGHVEVYSSETAAFDALDLGDVDDERRDDVEAFVENTEFDAAVLLYVASEGPNTGYDEIAIENLAVDGDAIVGTAIATAPEPGGGNAHVYPSALVRVTVDGDVPETVRMTVVDGWGAEDELESELGEQDAT